jgi:MFS family permease
MGLIYSCTIGNTVKWFPDKRGLVGGLTTAAYGLGSVALALILGGYVNATNVKDVFMVLGLIYAIVVCVGAFFITPAPAGYVPEGWSPPAPNPNVKAPTNKNWSEMIADPVFWVMILTLLSGAFFGLMMISNCANIARGTLVLTTTPAVIVSALALCNTAGRVVCGWVSDAIGRINTITIALVLAIVGLILINAGTASATPADNNANLFILGVCIVGFTFGAFMGVFPGFTADQFGPKNNGVNYGIMFIGFAIAGWFGPKILQMFSKPPEGATEAQLAGFVPWVGGFKVAIGIAVAGLVLTFIFRALTKKKA